MTVSFRFLQCAIEYISDVTVQQFDYVLIYQNINFSDTIVTNTISEKVVLTFLANPAKYMHQKSCNLQAIAR